MSLDSSDSFSEAAEGNPYSDRQPCLTERETHPESNWKSNWVFLFTHRIKLDKVNEILSQRFETFVHRTIVYQRRGKGKDIKKELPTVSGLIFIHGAADEVQKYLNDIFNGLYLVRNYSTGRTAEISNREMKAFMKLSNAAQGGGVRFMLHPLDYYSDGHHRIRITSGDLEGCEGYIVRIHRDRKLITQIGNMTVAIGGISKESFENAEEFVAMRSAKAPAPVRPDLTPAQQDIARCFFTPSSDLEAMAIANCLAPLIERFQKAIALRHVGEAVDGVLFTLTEIAGRFKPSYFKSESVGISEVCKALVGIIQEALASPEVDEPLKERIQVGLDALMLRYPAMRIDEYINEADLS